MSVDQRYPAAVKTGKVPTDRQPRCQGSKNGRRCRKMLAELVTRPWIIKCVRCGYVNWAEGPVQKSERPS